jgi:hypothetical protein
MVDDHGVIILVTKNDPIFVLHKLILIIIVIQIKQKNKQIIFFVFYPQI